MVVPSKKMHGNDMSSLHPLTPLLTPLLFPLLFSPHDDDNKQIALNQPFTVNVKYASDVPRPVDVHVDVLNAKQKLFYAGWW